MARKKRKSLLVVPPKGARIRFLRIRVSLIIFFFLFFAAGLAGYFIPFNTVTLDVVEQNQRKNLSEQNSKLLYKIHDMRKQLHVLTQKVSHLESRRQRVEKTSGTQKGTEAKATAQALLPALSLDELLNYTGRAEAMYRDLAKTCDTRPSLLYSIPVLEPVQEDAVVTAGFGEMRDPFTGTMKRHYGVDYAAKRETPVIATADGKVLSVETHKRWGRRIMVQHSSGFTTVYAHLGTVKTVKGKNVKRGDVIATVGMSGLTTGPHLHYEVRRGGTPLDPRDYIYPKVKPMLAGVFDKEGSSD